MRRLLFTTLAVLSLSSVALAEQMSFTWWLPWSDITAKAQVGELHRFHDQHTVTFPSAPRKLTQVMRSVQLSWESEERWELFHENLSSSEGRNYFYKPTVVILITHQTSTPQVDSPWYVGLCHQRNGRRHWMRPYDGRANGQGPSGLDMTITTGGSYRANMDDVSVMQIAGTGLDQVFVVDVFASIRHRPGTAQHITQIEPKITGFLSITYCWQ